ncbi:MAG: phosphate ABC transporter permease PstA [Pseudomonadota bacterium]
MAGTTAASSARKHRHLKRRNLTNAALKFAGLSALMLAGAITLLLIGTIFWRAVPAFLQHQVKLDVDFAQAAFESDGAIGSRDTMIYANYGELIGKALEATFVQVADERDKQTLRAIVSPSARAELRDTLLANPEWIGTRQSVWLPVSSRVESFLHSSADGPNTRSLAPQLQQWLAALERSDATRRSFRLPFFKRGDSRRPQGAGILGALSGSVLTLMVTFALSFPIGLASAVYLEEFAPKSRWIDLLEVNINNLAAVPSILFGLLGLAVFINVFHLPRATPLVGGMTLALMTLPTIIIAARAAIAAVPNSLKDAALSLGASPVQAVFHHVVPQAIPGVMTGTILAMAQALGETAPLLMIGMLAFIVDVPGSVTDVATTLPAQIFLWAESPNKAFSQNAAAAITVLLLILFLLNSIAVYLRNRFERPI